MSEHDPLAQAWRQIGVQELHQLVVVYLGWSGWAIADNKIQGGCPAPRPGPKCGADRSAGYSYIRDDRGPPWVYCHHRHTCGYGEPLFEILARGLGTRGAAAELIKSVAGVSSPPHPPSRLRPPTVRAEWPSRERLVVRASRVSSGPSQPITEQPRLGQGEQSADH